MTPDDPLAILRLYGLDELLTEADDPRLWAAAVAKHWPKPDDAELKDVSIYSRGPRFSFGIGQIPEPGHQPRHRSGMTIVQRWAFERVDDEHFKPIPGEAEYPHFLVDISRPSADTDMAWVHAGYHGAPLAGGGDTTPWKRQSDGSWIDTGEVVSEWIS